MGPAPPEANLPGASNANMIYVPVTVFAIICPAIVSLRIWTRVQKGGGMGADDWVIVASLIVALGSSGIMIASCQYGYGQHLVNLTPYNKVQAYMWFFICQTTYKWSISATKCSILLLYLRIFNKIRWLKWTCWILITLIALYCTISSFVSVFQCTPLQRAYDKSIEGRCIDNTKAWYANAGFSISTDVIILLLPMPQVWMLQIPRPQKAALALVFTLGIFVVVTSCLRVTTLNITATTPDVTFDIASTMWSIIEMNVAIVCACLPMMRVFLIRVFPQLLSRVTRKSQSGSSGARYGYAKYGLGSRGYVSSNGRPESEPAEWARTVEAARGVSALGAFHQQDQSSEEYILHDVPIGTAHSGVESKVTAGRLQDLQSPPGIHKTMQYSVKYSGGKHSREFD